MKKKVSLSTVLLAAAVLSTVPVAATETTTSSPTTTAATSVTTDTTSTTASTASTSLSTEASTTATTTTSTATSSQTMGKLNLTLMPNPGGDHFDLTVTTPVVRPRFSSIYLDLITVDQAEYSLHDYNTTEGEPAIFNSISVESLEARLGQIPDGVYQIYAYQRNTSALGRSKIAEASLFIKVVNGRIVDFNENRDALTAPETTTSEATTTTAATTSSTATTSTALTTTSPVTTTAAATTSQAARTTSQAQTSSKVETTHSKAPTAPVTSSSAKTGSKAAAKTDKEKTLPQTGETNSLLAIVGGGLLAFAAYFSLNRKNKKN